LEEIGLDGRRVQMINVSAAMGGQFAWSAAELTEEIRRMGPNQLKRDRSNPSEQIASNPDERIREEE
jgi:hypothetical protein